MSRFVLSSGVLVDPAEAVVLGERTVVAEDGVVVDVLDAPAAAAAVRSAIAGADVVLDAGGRFVLPGFVDAHVHLSITTMDFASTSTRSSVTWALEMAAVAEAMVARGYTTVRDTGGDVAGLRQAIRRGLVAGPRVVAAGRVLTQTGGHGDLRSRVDVEPPSCGCRIEADWFAHIADGVDAVRAAARHELRQGAGFLKLMASGGVASPSDPLEAVQYTHDEIAAIVTEAEHRGTYATAHAYTPAAIDQAVGAGVRCIEHGNLLDAATAATMAARGVTLVPTLITYQAMEELGEKFGLPEVNRAKNRGVLEAGFRAVELAREAGVTLGLGSDLLGEAHGLQNREFELRAEVEPAADVLRSAFVVNPELCGLAGKVGVVAPGAFADLVVVDADPTVDVASLGRWETNVAAVVSCGRVVRSRL